MPDLELIEAVVAISQVKARYCRTLDAKDWDAFANLFTDDFELDVPGADPVQGRDMAMAFIRSALAEAATAHQIHLPEIDLKGDPANLIRAMQDRNTWDLPRNGVSTQRGFGQ